jgi:hypothetical protein
MNYSEMAALYNQWATVMNWSLIVSTPMLPAAVIAWHFHKPTTWALIVSFFLFIGLAVFAYSRKHYWGLMTGLNHHSVDDFIEQKKARNSKSPG